MPYALATILMLAVSYASDRTRHRRVFVWPFLLVGTAAFYGSYAVGTSHFGAAFALLVVAGGVMYAPYGPYFAFIPEFLPTNAAGPAMGLINAFGALGGFADAYVVGVLGGDSRSGGAFVFMAAALFASAILMLFCFVKRPSELAAASPSRLATPVGPALVPMRAFHAGRIKTA